MVDERSSEAANRENAERREEYLERIVDQRIADKIKIVEQKIDYSDKINRLIDIFAIIIAAIVAFYTYRISIATDSMRDDSFIQVKNAKLNLGLTDKALTIADNSFSETKHANEATLNNFRLQQRAYVLFDGWVSNSIDDIFTKLKNAGLTPAKEVIHNRRLMIGKFDDLISIVKNSDQKNFDFQNYQMISLGPNGNIPDQQVVLVGHKYENYILTDKDKNLFNSGENVAMLWGIVRYKDIFGIVHITRYCGFFENGNTRQITYCPIHNDMD